MCDNKLTTATYKITRFYRYGDSEVIKTGLTLEQAQEHCNDLETSSTTCTSKWATAITDKYGPWFDGYTKELK